MRKDGFSLVEAMVAGIIFTIGVVGVFSSLAAIKKPTVTKDKSLSAAYCGQEVLEDLRAKVDVRDWNTGTNDYNSDLSIGQHTATSANYSSCAGYTVVYNVTDAGNGVRKVTTTVSW